MPKTVWLLIIGMLVNTTANSFLWPMNAIYMHQELGQTLSVAGLVLMGNAAAGVVGNFLGGFLFDKIGGFKAIMIGVIITVIGLVLLTIWHGWPHYIWFLALIGFSGGIVFPSMYALIGIAWPEGGRKGFNAIYLSQNLGVAVGPVLAGIVASYSFDYLFVANLLMYIVFFVIALFFIRIKPSETYAQPSLLNDGKKVSDRSAIYSLCILGVGFLLAWLVYSQWSTTISTYTQELGISLKQYSLLWSVNGLLILIGQPLINPIIKRMEGKFKSQIMIGLVIFIASFVVVSYAGTFKMFMVAIIIITFGEMFIWPVVPTIASILAPKGRDGFFQGMISSFAAIGKMLGPFIGGVLADVYGMHMMFLLLLGFLVVAVIPFAFYDLPQKRQHEKEHPTT